VTIGLSLPFGYLAGAVESPLGESFAEAFGDPDSCLAELREHGVGSIELKRFGPTSSAEVLLSVAERILGSGLKLSLHGYLTGSATGRTFGDLYPPLLPTVDWLKERQGEVVMVVHSLVDAESDYTAVLESTGCALQRLAEGVRASELPIRVALEINRFHGHESPGTTYDGILEIARRVRGVPGLGFCWDIGHTRSSELQGRLAASPPDEFVEKVIHTHVHGLSTDADTHWPVTESSSHIAAGVRRLRSVGYDGTYNLELYPTRWEPGPDAARRGILDSVRCLREILNTAAE
jgi:sugar phosphate isomerase/epimerase